MRKIILIIIATVFVSHKCENSKIHATNNTQLRVIRILGKIPMFTSDSSFVVTNSYDVFYSGDLIMYKFKYRFDSILNGKLLLQEWRSNFFVFHKDSLFGYSYYPIKNSATTESRVSIDTMFKKNAYEPFRFDSIFHKPDSVYFQGGNLIKVFNSTVSTKYPEKNTYYLYYSRKFAGLTESFFSKSMDNERNMKLFKIRIVAHGHYYPEYNFNLPEREYFYEMTEILLENKQEILNYFDRYKRDI